MSAEDLLPEQEAEEEADFWEEEERNRPNCGCKLCICFQRTEYGESCEDCVNHAHQG